MSSCISSFFSCLSRTLLNVIRGLLMFCCLLILLSQIMSIWAMYTVQNEIMDEYLPGYRVHWHSYLTCVGTAILALIGIHGTYTKDPRYLKVFALLAFSLAACYLLFYSDWAERMWAEKRESFAETMEEMAHQYQWELNGEPAASAKKNKATDLWDMLQGGTTCCGLTGPQDWTNNNDFKVHKKGWLPNSCCFAITRAINRERPDGKLKCTLEDAYQVGCMQRMDQIVATVYKRQVVAAVLYFILASWAFILSKVYESEAAEAALMPQAVAYVPNWQRGAPPAYYMSSMEPAQQQHQAASKNYTHDWGYQAHTNKLMVVPNSWQGQRGEQQNGATSEYSKQAGQVMF